jgi:hypothetical protein
MMRATRAEFVIDEAALTALLAGPNGPVAKELGRLGARIEGEAKQLLSGDLVNVDTGRLRSSTTWRLFRRGQNLGVAVGSGVHYAEPVHNGGPRQVRAHTRTRKGGRAHQVRAHTRNITARPYLKIAASRVLGRPIP